MTVRPDPTFHATAKLAMEAPPERYAYTLMLSPDFSQPDGLAVVDVDPGSQSYGKIVHSAACGRNQRRLPRGGPDLTWRARISTLTSGEPQRRPTGQP